VIPLVCFRSTWLKPKGKKLLSDAMSDDEDDGVVSSVPTSKPKVHGPSHAVGSLNDLNLAQGSVD
jgi:hypothetical protein